MSKKIKKYIFLIPTLFVMLFNCLCYGQVIFSANAIDYNEYFKPVEDCPHTFDFTDVDTILARCNVWVESLTGKDRQQLRSILSPGIARAMAYQFTNNFYVI